MEDNIINWENTYAVLKEYAETLKRKYQDQIIAGKHIKTGNLLNHISYTFNTGATSIELVFNLEDYWKYLEFGTYDKKDGQVGEFINIIATPVIPAKTFSGNLPTMGGLKGITPYHMLGNATFETEMDIEDKLEQAIAKDLDYGINVLLVKGLAS